MIIRARESSWAFKTSQNANLSIGTWASLVKENGTIWLDKQRTPTDKENAIPYTFDYDSVGVGVGLSTGTVMVSVGPKVAPSIGKVYMLDSFTGTELTADDLTGVCRIQEFSFASRGGVTATAMFLGIDWDDILKMLGVRLSIFSLPAALVAKYLLDDDIDWTDLVSTKANALLVIAGLGATGGAAAGISDAVGELRQSWEDTHVTTQIDMPSPYDPPGPPSGSTPQQEEAPPIVLDGANFQTGMDTFTAAAEGKLREAKNKIANYRNRFLTVEGFTDTAGHGTYDNQSLSERRAKRVKQWLIQNADRKDADVIATGYGEQYPVASNGDEAGRAKNRRVEIHIMQASWRPR